MNKIHWIFLIVLGTASMSANLHAGLYYWTDENGIKHFSTIPPDEDVDLITVIPEVPYDEAADRERMEQYREFREEKRENFMEEIRRMEAEERARIAEKERREAALKEALEAARLAREAERAEREREEAMDDDDTDDKTLFIQPKRDPLGLNPNPEQRRIEPNAPRSRNNPLGM
jgi:hypothetical protein